MLKSDELAAKLEARAPILRARILKMVNAAHAGHPGGSLSAIDLINAIMVGWGRFRPTQQQKDWFVLGKGHAVPGMYSVLIELGYLPEEELYTYRKMGSRLQGHPDRNKLPGIQVNTGHLGQGLSCAVGLAWADKFNGKDRQTYVMIGNGDLNEGQTWEAIQSAAKFALDNLLLVIDDNKLTQHGEAAAIMNVYPVEAKLVEFGWHVQRIDGHNYNEIINALKTASAVKGKPRAIVCDTVKGKGVSFMENVAAWHSTDLPNDLLQVALAELGQEDQ